MIEYHRAKVASKNIVRVTNFEYTALIQSVSRMIKITRKPSLWLFSYLGLGLAIVAAPISAVELDSRSASVRCALDKAGAKVLCDYRNAASLSIKDVSLKVDGQAAQITDKSVTTYPAPGQSTAIMIMVDTSDPARKITVNVKNVRAIAAMLAMQRPHQKIGIGNFDSDLHVLAPIGADTDLLKNVLPKIVAAGQATEFYKSSLAAINLLKNTDATRKGLIILSDGKVEDSAYTRADVIKAAKEAAVTIMTLGYLERSSDSPFLQTMTRLAEETYGLHFDATDQVLPFEITSNPFAFVERGARVAFSTESYWGIRSVTLILRTNDGKSLELKTNIRFPDRRTRLQWVIDFGREYWLKLLGGSLLIVISTAGLLLYRRRAKRQAPEPVQYATLSEMDGSRTQYVMNKTAITIGRSKDSDIHLENDSISSHHAEIHRRREGGFYIVDLASTNGVHVNESKVTQCELQNGDLLELGEVRIRFSLN